jgi:integrase
MPGKRAKILSAPDVNDLLVFASCTRHPRRNTLIVLLSAKAGLRAGEIANLTWDMLVDASGAISGLLELRDTAAKKGSGRSIPIHPDLAGCNNVGAAARPVAARAIQVARVEPGQDAGPMKKVVH